MELTWQKGYEDYTDTANWQPRYEKLCRFAEQLGEQEMARCSDAQLLDSMERLEELMRYYCVQDDMKKLEPAMRKFNSMMELCRSRGMGGVEVLYLQMLFHRINAMLYRRHGQHRQGAEGYDKCLVIARKCLDALKTATHLSEEQTLFVGWNCVECWKEAGEAHDAIMDMAATERLLRETVEIVKSLDKYLIDNPGLCDQASEIYANAAGVFYQSGDLAAGNQYYREAVRLLNTLDTVHGSDFYRARAIWMLGIHGAMAFIAAQDPGVMLQCEKEAAEYLVQRPRAAARDRAIVEGTKATVTFQRSVACQQNGQLPDAIRLAKDSIAAFERSMDILEKDYADRQGYYRTVQSRIVARINNMRTTAMESLGIMHYQNQELEGSEQVLKAVLDELNKTEGPKMAGSAAVVIQAEVLQYLSMIACDRGDGYQTDFYGTQSADMAYTLGRDSGQNNAWILAIVSCSLVAETALSMKNKAKAATYAQMGLDACDALERTAPNTPQLALRSTLAKFKKKASRKFF